MYHSHASGCHSLPHIILYIITLFLLQAGFRSLFFSYTFSSLLRSSFSVVRTLYYTDDVHYPRYPLCSPTTISSKSQEELTVRVPMKLDNAFLLLHKVFSFRSALPDTSLYNFKFIVINLC